MVEIHPRKHQRSTGEFIKSKVSGQEYNKETNNLKKSYGLKDLQSLLDRQQKRDGKLHGESERGEESTDRREAVKRPAKRPLLFNDQDIRSEEEESPRLGIDPSFFE